MRTLLVIDKATGETERVPETDGNFVESILSVMTSEPAEGHSYASLLKRLDEGQEIATAGFIRRLEKVDAQLA